MPWKRLELKGEEISELKSFMRGVREKEEYMRALIVLMRTEKPYRQIAKELGVALSTTYHAIRRYKERGIDGLRSVKGGGRKRRIREEERGVIVEVVLKSPQLFGFIKNNWSLRALSKFLTVELGIEISKSHVHRMLREAGIVYKRPKTWVMSQDKDYEEKSKKIENYKKVAKAMVKKGLF